MSYELMFQKAIALHQNGALNEAEQLYRQILETAPTNADVLNLLGLVAQAKGIHNEAVSYFYKAINSAPNHFPIFFNLAVSLEAEGRHLEATEAYQRVLKLKPDIKEAHLGLGNIFWQQEKNEAAAAEFSAALALDADYIEAKTNLAEINNDVESLKQLSADSHNAAANYYLGRRAFNDKDYQTAAQCLFVADQAMPSDEIKSMLGQSLRALNKKDEALKIFYQAYNLNSRNATVLTNIADLETENENYKEAEQFYKKAIENDPQSLSAHTNFANLLCKRKRTLEALEEYRKAVLISPKTPELSYNLAIILKTLEEYEQALDLMFYAFYLDTSRTDWSLNLAETITLFHRSAPEKAKKIAENWYQKMPENTIIKHLWAAINNHPAEIDTEKAYNRLLFDNFAPTYEQTLQTIEYRVIDKIKELYPSIVGNILDLGCGTGLVAEKLKTANNNFTGVDISPVMLDYARQKNLYSELVENDITSYLQGNKTKFDLIIAADVFCYFGELETIIKLCHPQNIIFSIETDDSLKDFQIQTNGRYKHNPQYIENILKKYGYRNISLNQLVLRREYGQDVIGSLVIANV